MSEQTVVHLRSRRRLEAPAEPVLLTKREAAARLRISERTLNRWMERGIVPHVYLDDNPQLLRFPREALDKLWQGRVEGGQ